MDRAMFGMGLTALCDGLRVASVSPGGPAAEAGIQAGDLIVEIAGEAPIFADNLEMIRWANDHLKAGEATELSLARGDTLRAVTVVGRAPTCEEAMRLSHRLAGGVPEETARTCRPNGDDSLNRGHELASPDDEGERLAPEFVELLTLAEEHGWLELRVAGKAEGFEVGIAQPPGIPGRFSALHMTSEIRQAAEELDEGEQARFVLRTYPSDDGERRHSIQQLDPDS